MDNLVIDIEIKAPKFHILKELTKGIRYSSSTYISENFYRKTANA